MHTGTPHPNHAETTQVSTNTTNSSRLEKITFRIFLGTIILAPLVFWPSVYIAQDFVKTFVIVFGIIISSIMLMFVVRKKYELILPQKRIVFVGSLLALSVIVSVIAGDHADKSFFGQGFEIGTANLILTMFLAAIASFVLVAYRIQRAMLINVSIIGTFLSIFLFQFMRFVPTVSGSNSVLFLIKANMIIVIGNWSSLGIYALLVTIISIISILILPLSFKIKSFYGVMAFLGIVTAVLIGNTYAWICMAIVAAFLSYQTFGGYFSKSTLDGKSFSKKTLSIFVILTLISVGFAWKTNDYLLKAVSFVNPGYAEVVFPWSYTSEIIIDTIKDRPLFGFGPNHFVRAYIDHKPAEINLTPAWNAEFGSGFSTISTFVVTQGLIGSILWFLFILLFVSATLHVFRNLPSESHQRFVLVASFSGALFMWLSMIFSISSHASMLYTFVLTGTALGSAVFCGILKPTKITFKSSNSILSKILKFTPIIIVIIFLVWGIFYLRQSIALINFASGLKSLTVGNDPDAAAVSFGRAAKIDPSDIFWRAQVEAMLSKVGKIVQTNDATQKAEDKVLIVTGTINDALFAARSAISYDSDNYYNYLSEGRVFETAAKLNMDGAIDAAVESYKNAIKSNIHNPELYLVLARFQASANKLDDALQSAGAAIEEKQNYLEAVYLISQIQVAKGNIPDAIIAARVATEINPSSPLLWFQLGVLNYSDKKYTTAVDAFANALKIVPDYANAQYFLGLSYAYLGKSGMAIELFKKLIASNPDSQEVKLILSNLESGRQPFADARPPITSTPEKRSTLPIKENN